VTEAPVSAMDVIDAAWCEAWSVPEPVNVSTWAERRRVLEADNSARPGRWSNEDYPFLVEIMNAVSDPRIRKVSSRKPSQNGGTEAMYNSIFWANEQAPGPAYYVHPTKDELAKVLQHRLLPAMRAVGSCSAAGVGVPDMDDAGQHRAAKASGLMVQMTRMHLNCVGSNVPVAMKSWPARYAFIDELDECAEGTSVLIEERLSTFPERKLVRVSTPKVAEPEEGIDLAFSQSDRRRWHVPCPHCGFYQELRFSRLKWDGGVSASQEKVKSTLRYECHDCGAEIAPVEKRGMVRRGVWVPAGMEAERHTGRLSGERLGPADHAGFTWSKLISPRTEWWEIAWGWCERKGKPDAEWYGQTFGEPWSAEGVDLPWERVKQHFAPLARGGYQSDVVPLEAVCLTAGIDVQRAGLWVTVRAWSAGGKRSWLVYSDYRDAPLKDRAAAEAAVADVRRWTFPMAPEHPGRAVWGDRGMPIWGAMVDSGDGVRTDEVYGWCQTPVAGGCQLIAAKGVPDLGPYPFRPSTATRDAAVVEREDRRELELILVSNLYYKSRLAGFLHQTAVGESSIAARAAGDGADADAMGAERGERWFWPAWPVDEMGREVTECWHRYYCKHVTSEKLAPVRTSGGRGRVSVRWVLKRAGDDNHLWDADVLAACCADVLGVDRAEVPAWARAKG